MQNQALQLEIEGSWWLWRGYLQDGYGCLTSGGIMSHVDPVDTEKYAEASAFPTHKPYFDIFGVPRRSRSQRGWYQVRRPTQAHPKQHPSDLSVSKSPPDSFKTAADAPIELVRRIGKLMSKSLQWRTDGDKRIMMTCALVCRHWASHFLPNIFRLISLRSRQRAFELCEFDRTPQCWFHRFVKPSVYVDIGNLSQLSCIHLLASHGHIGLRLAGPLPPSWKTIRSVHQALPRSLPRSLCGDIATLVLTNIHFQRFSDFIHLICEHPGLKVIDCTSVTWGPIPATFGVLPRRRYSQQCPSFHTLTVCMKNMPTSWARAQVHILAHLLIRNGLPCLSDHGMVALLTIAHLVECMSEGIIDKSDAHHVMMELYWRDGYFTLQWSRRNKTSIFRIQAVSEAGPHGNALFLDVKDAIVDRSYVSDYNARWKVLDWHKLDEQVALLDPTQFVFIFKSREHMLAFGDDVIDVSMPRTSACGSLRYAVKRQGAVWDYYKVSRDSEALQAPTGLQKLWSPFYIIL